MKLLFTVLFVLSVVVCSNAQSINDSLNLHKKLQSIEKLLQSGQAFHHTIEGQQVELQKKIDSLIVLQQAYEAQYLGIAEMENLKLDSLQGASNRIVQDLHDRRGKNRALRTYLLVSQIVCIVFIVLLGLYIRKIRKDSSSYLVSRAKGLYEQNEEILHKASELQFRNEELKLLLSTNQKKQKQKKEGGRKKRVKKKK